MSIDTADLRRVVAAMTPGEWSVWQDAEKKHYMEWALIDDKGESLFKESACSGDGICWRDDAVGIAYLRNNALAQADEIDRLREQLATQPQENES